MPTAHGISPLKEQIVSSQEPLVWAFPTGTEIGLALTPLYPSVPLAASLDPQVTSQREYDRLSATLRKLGLSDEKFAPDPAKRRLRQRVVPESDR
jgi:hypothetical protein